MSILIYHRVLPSHDTLRPNEPTAEEFSWQMEMLNRYFVPLPLHKALELLQNEELPQRAVCVTFDDGYADNESVALPILKKWAVPATVFVSTAFLNGGRMWNDTVIEAIRVSSGEFDLRVLGLGIIKVDSDHMRLEAINSILTKLKYMPQKQRADAVNYIESLVDKNSLQKDLMLTNQQLINLKESGVEIGAHTVDHPILMKLEHSESRRQIENGKLALEDIIGTKIRYFAYPNGILDKDYNVEHTKLINDIGFEAAVTTNKGVTTKESDIYQLPRFTPWDKIPIKFMIRMFLNQFDKN
ncbi:MAG: polysaccharide deacetylase family protein [Sedimenticola sp.]